MASVQEMIERTEIAVRDEIRKIPDGVYTGAAATDDDGTVLDEPVWVRARITVKGDEMTIDFSESDAQRKGFINSVYAATYGNAIAAAILYFDPALADYHNQGTMAPIKVVAPLGSVVNCEYPATVGASPVNVGNQIMEAVLEALAKALPGRAVAAWGKHRGDYVFAMDPRTGEPYVRTSFDYDGSGGAVAGYDGYQAVSSVTALGARTATMSRRWRSACPGGAGMGVRSRFHRRRAMARRPRRPLGSGQRGLGRPDGDWELRRRRGAGPGALGGEPAPVSPTYLRRNGEDIRVKPHRLVPVKTGTSWSSIPRRRRRRQSGRAGSGDWCARMSRTNWFRSKMPRRSTEWLLSPTL